MVSWIERNVKDDTSGLTLKRKICRTDKGLKTLGNMTFPHLKQWRISLKLVLMNKSPLILNRFRMQSTYSNVALLFKIAQKMYSEICKELKATFSSSVGQSRGWEGRIYHRTAPRPSNTFKIRCCGFIITDSFSSFTATSLKETLSSTCKWWL